MYFYIYMNAVVTPETVCMWPMCVSDYFKGTMTWIFKMYYYYFKMFPEVYLLMLIKCYTQNIYIYTVYEENDYLYPSFFFSPFKACQ